MKSSGSKPSWKRVQSQIQSDCLCKPRGLCSLRSFDGECDVSKASRKVQSYVGKSLCVLKGVSFASQEHSESDLDKLCRICCKSSCQMRSCSCR